MQNKTVVNTGRIKYAEVFKPLYAPVAGMPVQLNNIGYSEVYDPYYAKRPLTAGCIVMYITGGGGRLQMENKEILLKAGEIVLYARKQGDLPAFLPENGVLQYKWIDICGDAATFYFDRILQGEGFVHFPYQTEKFGYLFEKIYNALLRRHQSAPYKICEYAVQLLTDLLLAKEEIPVGSRKYQENLERVFAYIDAHYAENITVEQLSKLFLCSKFHFIRLFRAHTGMTPISYVSRVRIYKAADLLSDAEVSVEEAAYRTGYKSVSQFIEKFRQIMGTTPNKYKKITEIR